MAVMRMKVIRLVNAKRSRSRLKVSVDALVEAADKIDKPKNVPR